MSIERIALALAGALIVLSLALSYVFNPYWLTLSGFVVLAYLSLPSGASAHAAFRKRSSEAQPEPSAHRLAGAAR